MERIPTLKEFFTGEDAGKTTAAQKGKVERCVKKLKKRAGRKKAKSPDYGICWASVLGKTKRKR